MRAFIIGGVTVSADDPSAPEERTRLVATCRLLGRKLAETGKTIVVCSPFEHSADRETMLGVAMWPGRTSRARIEIHYPDHPTVRDLLPALQASLLPAVLDPVPHAPLDFDDKDSKPYAWLLSQLMALDRSNVVIAIGGREEGTAGMLLRLAEGRSKPVLPLPALGGAAFASFHRRKYELQDALGEELVTQLLSESDAVAAVAACADQLAQPRTPRSRSDVANRCKFFISYARARPAEADQIEMILRRRNRTVLRDEQDVGPGHDIPQRLNEFLVSADVCIVVWCKEYACSPWCWDEFDLALERHGRAELELWILCVDDTRMVPREARNLNSYAIKNRDELEGRLASLLERRPVNGA